MATEHRRDQEAKSSTVRYNKWLMDTGRGVLNIEAYQEAIQEDRPTLTKVTVKCDPDDEEGVLLIVNGYQAAEWLVAFHREATVGQGLASLGNRLRNGSLKWRKDEYAKTR